jgi:hypothetical protein
VKLETRKEQHISGITAAGIKFFRETAKHALFGHKGNEDVLKALEMQSVLLRSSTATVNGTTCW